MLPQDPHVSLSIIATAKSGYGSSLHLGQQMNSGYRSRANSRYVFLANLPFGVEALGRHAELTVAVVLNQVLLVGRKGTGTHRIGSVSRGSRSSSHAISALIQAALRELGANQIK
jgi:hypothetical protein